jgi:diadenosine tetraphosphatase ApaH/serine/threonine PP2A family protein phosphatase
MGEGTKYAILGDIHGNIEALEAVLENAASLGVTAYACVGDIVGYNACPGACVDRMIQLKCACVQGNHDYYCAHDDELKDFHPMAASVVEWTRHVLTEEQKDYLRKLRQKRLVDGFTMVHSTLDAPEKWGYVFDELQAEAHFAYQTSAVCFHGHTHVPVVFQKTSERTMRLPAERIAPSFGQKLFINVGSVGQPRDGDPRACFATFELETKAVEFHRVVYDVAGTQKRILENGLPEWLARRLALGK